VGTVIQANPQFVDAANGDYHTQNPVVAGYGAYAGSAPPGTYTLTVAKAGTGSGTVASSPAGISCGADCSEAYNSGAVVTLSPTAGSGSTFGGWSGACTGTGACQVTMKAAKSVTATFVPELGPLDFFTLTPCRLLDSRPTAYVAGSTHTILASGRCGVPVTAESLAVNVTVTAPTRDGDLRVQAADLPLTNTSIVNFRAGETRANNAVVRLDPSARFLIYVGMASGSVQVIVDVVGYFE
jgi:hypothetical protein